MMERKTRKEKEDLESQYKKKQQSSLSDNKSQMMRKQIESQMVQNNLTKILQDEKKKNTREH
ncbi:hypothetical protein CJJ19_05180 [Candidatus Williamhamiltonella defendens]|nr:hypothetical protein [Candidatus Hamiltonella defensa]AYB48925.1 hypothetical protein CJJ19_05180 [Candidatus Hamiltonella defensa]